MCVSHKTSTEIAEKVIAVYENTQGERKKNGTKLHKIQIAWTQRYVVRWNATKTCAECSRINVPFLIPFFSYTDRNTQIPTLIFFLDISSLVLPSIPAPYETCKTKRRVCEDIGRGSSVIAQTVAMEMASCFKKRYFITIVKMVEHTSCIPIDAS